MNHKFHSGKCRNLNWVPLVVLPFVINISHFDIYANFRCRYLYQKQSNSLRNPRKKRLCYTATISPKTKYKIILSNNGFVTIHIRTYRSIKKRNIETTLFIFVRENNLISARFQKYIATCTIERKRKERVASS